MDYSNTHSATGTPVRTGSPEIDASPAATGPRNPFMSPFSTRPNSIHPSSSAVDLNQQTLSRRYFHSRRIKKGEIEKPWLKRKDPREKWVTIIPLIGLVIGIGIAGFLIWDGLRTVVNHQYCQILNEDFSEGFNDKIWSKEVEVGGFGNGQFEETTGNDENVFVKNGQLWIMPTLQDQSLIDTNNVMNLTKDGTCSSDQLVNCVAITNSTNGTIVNPVKSGRINTKKGASIKYGRVEVTAQLPAGDWLWPAIWMMPVNDTYGQWPKSGEIDIMESRGNNYTYPQGGNNIFSSTLHWGPDQTNDAWWRTNSKRTALHTTYAAGFHTFGMEWSENYIFTYVDSRLLQVLYFDFHGSLWQRGNFPLASGNGTSYVDPWSATGRASTPFDQPFYLILNVAVGATNGWFQDGVNGKPWVDSSPTAKRDFWNARAQWQPTWQGTSQMVIKKVAMWQQQGYNGC